MAPVIIYGGLARLAIVSERKKTFQFVAHAQEVFLHTLPLSYLVIENSSNDEIKFTNLAFSCIAMSVLNLILTFFEICIL